MKIINFAAALLLMASLANCSSTSVDNGPTKTADSIPADTTPKTAPLEKAETFAEAHITADWKKDEKGASYVTFCATEKSDVQTSVVFRTDNTVRDFKVLALTFVDVVDGKVKFDVKELYTLERFTPQLPFLLTTTFYGDIPNNGISYVDHTGKTRRFSVSESGKDGSVELCEF